MGLGLGLGSGLEIRVVVAQKWAHGSRVEPVPQKGSSTSEQGPAPANFLGHDEGKLGVHACGPNVRARA